MSVNLSSCLDKQTSLERRFHQLIDVQEKYALLIEMGRILHKKSNPLIALPKNLVRGCQSEVFLTGRSIDGEIFFDFYSEALISTGLVALLLDIYQGELGEVILKCPPLCLERLGLYTSLTPTRINGLANIYLKMQQEALRLLLYSHREE